MNVNKRLNVNFRTGYRLNILDVLQNLEDKYRSSLEVTCDAYETYDEVSNETFNDKLIFIAELHVLLTCGYINEDEFTSMVPIADDIRLNILEKLEKEGVENGSKETEQ